MRQIIVQRLLGLCVLLASTFLGNAFAQATTYTATSTSNYTSFTNHTTCNTGPCNNFDSSMAQSGSFTTSSPLATNLSSSNIYPLVTSFNFSDGLTTYSSTDPQVRIYAFNVSTDAAGRITSSQILLERWNTPGTSHAVNDRLSVFQEGSAYHNTSCMEIDVSSVGTADTCAVITDTSDTSFAGGAVLSWSSPVATSTKSIPTLSHWGLIFMAAFMGLAAWFTLRGRRLLG